MSLSSAASIAMATVNAIVAADLGGGAAWAGTPSAMILIGGAAAAPLWGLVSERSGRRASLMSGMAAGILGGGLGLLAVQAGSLHIFLLGMVLVGMASAAVQLSRFAAGEVHPPGLRGRAISTVVLGGAVGSVVGPLVVGPSGRLALVSGLTELAGPYAAAVVLFLVGVALVAVALWPEPQSFGREVGQVYQPASTAPVSRRPLREILSGRAAGLAVVAMVVGQAVMVMVMVITSLHMRGHGHPLGSISLVIASHTFGMFAFSVVSGRLADRYGRVPVILAGSLVLVLACLAATWSPEVVPLALSLFLLGLGWNFCYVGGSSLLADQLRPTERGRTQGFNDLLVGAASATGSLGSGLVFAAAGYSTMALVGAVAALIPVGLAIAWRDAAPTFPAG